MIGVAKNNRLWLLAAFLFLMTALLWKPSVGAAEPAKTVIEIQRPAPGETHLIVVPKNATLSLLFNANEARLDANATDLVFGFADDGLIIFAGLLVRDDLETINFVINGESVNARTVIAQAQPRATGKGPNVGKPDPPAKPKPVTVPDPQPVIETPDIEPAAGSDSGGETSLPNLSDLRHTGRDLLFPGEAERGGHPLYSYLLFSGASRGEREDRARFTSAIEAYVGRVRTTEALEKGGASRASINIFYAPLKEIFEDTSPASMRLHFAQRSPDEQIEILTRLYDHARAEVLMGQLRLRGNGPIIVSVLRPLSDGAVDQDEAFLVQDLSSVPPKLVGLWVDEFKRQVVQEATDSPEHLRQFALTLRTKISVLAEGFEITKSAVAKMFETPKGEGGD